MQTLQLADGNPAQDSMGNYLPSYLRDNYSLAQDEAMMLAQNPNAIDYQLAEDAQSNTNDSYFFIPNPNQPGGGKYVRQDLFDDLSDLDWITFVESIEPFQPNMSLFGLGKRAAEKEKSDWTQSKKD